MRVAICSYWYPPARTIASLRIAKFVKYMPDFGWDPYVFTITPVTNRYTAAGGLEDAAQFEHVYRVPDPSVHVWVDRLAGGPKRPDAASDAGPNAGAPGRAGRLAYRLYRDLVCVPDEAWPWLRHYRTIRAAAAAVSVDLVFSSSPPATAHLLARRLARDLGKPWVADLRDPWSDMHTIDRSAARHWLDVRMERRTLRDAAALTTVSGTMADRFASDYAVPVHVIMNGYDPADVPQDIDAAPAGQKLTFVYTGMLYEGRRTPQPVFEALRALHQRGDIDLSLVRIELYGRNLSIAERQLREFPELASSVELGGELGYRESLVAQRKATVLLLLEWPDPRAAGVVTGKIFEYLAAERPILAIGPAGGEIDRVLRMTNRGVLAESAEQLESAIKKMYDDFRASGPAHVDTSVSIEQFSRRTMTRRLTDVFTASVGRGGQH